MESKDDIIEGEFIDLDQDKEIAIDYSDNNKKEFLLKCARLSAMRRINERFQ